MATNVLGLHTFTASEPWDFNIVNDNSLKIDNGVKTALQGRAAQNLLDNSYFKNKNEIVNQRGETSYTSGNEYTIDRWRTTYYTSLSIQDGYINVYGKWNVRQILINPKNGVYTFAAKIRINSKGDNQPYMSLAGMVKYLDAPIGQWKTYVSTCDLSAVSDDEVNFVIDVSGNTTDGSLSVEWAALYEGSYTADTLPAYVPKDNELAECQWHFERLGGTFSQLLGNAVFAKAGAKSVIISIKYSPKRLHNPTLSFSNPSEYRMLQKDAVNASTISAHSITSIDSITTETPFAFFRVNLANALAADAWLILQRADGATGAYIDVNADM